MNKRDEINKKSIIIGITSVAIIAIAIITVIGIFTIKSHAQEKVNDKVALGLLKKSEKQTGKLTKNSASDRHDYALGVVKTEKKNSAKAAFKNTEQAVKDQDKDASTVAVSKSKDKHKAGSSKVEKLALHKASKKVMKGVV